MADFKHEHEAELKLDEIHYTTKEDIRNAYARHLQGDKEARGFLLSILASHDGEALQNILDFLPKRTQAQRNVVLWLIPARITLMTKRARIIQQAARRQARADPTRDCLAALEDEWVRVYWAIVQYHS